MPKRITSRKPRQHVNSTLLLELLTGVYMALFNGAPDLALRAIEAMHQRAQYEILADVILVGSRPIHFLFFIHPYPALP